ncbi:MAG: FkbM family methyltransferase [Pseudomonadota bacterium]
MSFISYAQNFEDVMLWRALCNVDNGFYIDVGAFDPQIDSVTKAFYDRGWRGINIDPSTERFAALLKDRPRDLNLNIAVDDHAGERPFFEILDTGLSSVVDSVAERHRAAGRPVLETCVAVQTLASICDQHVTGEIHFLKVDVEGAERAVLAGMDFRRFRPWIVIVEATEPMTQNRIEQEWEGILAANDYRQAYFDGLNCFFIANEQAELSKFFAVPPNVFDDFIRAEECRLRTQLEERDNDIAYLLERSNTLRSSFSWKITRPLRGANWLLKQLSRLLNARK